MAKPVFRFAPSPNGPLHLGHAYSALFTAHAAARAGGRFLLRIEDIDLVRSRQQFVDLICEDLAWLGLEWEQPVRRQSAHFDEYHAALARLEADGLIYPSFATRADIFASVAGNPDHPIDPDGGPLYPGLGKALSGTERDARIAAGDAFALRLDMAKALEVAAGRGPLTFIETGSGPAGETGEIIARPERWGDVILARKDVKTSYHLSVVVDDALQGITDVTRGQDLFHATDVHRLLQALLGLPVPRYHHHELIREQDTGRKLSKSAGDASLKSMREHGVSAAEIRAALGFGG